MPCGGDWGSGGYNDCSFERNVGNKATRAACDLIRAIRKGGGEPLNLPLPERTLNWIKQHDKQDRKRRAQKKKLARQTEIRIRLRKRALAKLTRKEIDALNITDEE